MDPLVETAQAKVNLTLKVLGRRSDGYHELISLVMFASLGDTLQLEPGDELSLAAGGAFCANLDGDNLVLQAARLMNEMCPDVRTGTFTLVKNLPVAAGIGGGSADAAAALRLISRANPGVVTAVILEEAACQLGSDVPVCLISHAAMMRGRGELISPIELPPTLNAVLVNPGASLAAGDVYAALEAPELDEIPLDNDGSENNFSPVEVLLKHISRIGNNLQRPAIKLAPVIGDVISALSQEEGCQAAQMSGSGSTCFGIFANAGHAAGARDRLQAAHPDWWIVSTRLE